MKEIVIKVPDVIAETENEINIVLKDIQNECIAEHVDGAFHELFECSVLPKGHGRLIDADAFIKKSNKDRAHSCYIESWTADDVLDRLRQNYASTIIEADEGNE